MAFMRSPVRPRLAPPSYAHRTLGLQLRMAGQFGKREIEKIISQFSKDWQMIRKHHILLIKFFTAASFFCFILCFLVSYHGLGNGILCTMLLWSLYVLCIPAPHGKVLLGIPCRFLFDTIPSTEPYLWSFMVTINIFSYIFAPDVYQLTLPTQFLYLIISTPYPCWITFFTAFPGTFYRSLVGAHRYKARHVIIRCMLIIGGIVSFIFFTHKELITLLHTVANQIG